MKRLIFKENRSVFKEWLYSYICVAVVPMLLCFGIYFVYEKVLIAEMRNQNEYVMNTVKKNSEHVLTNVKNFSFILLNDTALAQVIEMENVDEYWGNKAVYEVNQRMINFGKYNIGDYSSIYIYIRNTDTVLADGGIIESKAFYDNAIKPSGRDFEEWKEDINEKRRIIQNQTLYRDRNTNKICRGIECLFPVGDGEATIAIIINENAIFGDILNTEWGRGSYIYLYDSKDRLILSNKNDLSDEPRDFSKKNENSDKERLTAFVSEDTTTWRIITEVDKSLLYRAKYVLRWSFIVLMLIGFVLSIFVIRVLLRHNYRPVSDLMSMVKSDEKNEFAAVKSLMMGILAQNSMLSEENTRQAVKLHNIILEKIIKNEIHNDFVHGVDVSITDTLFVHPCFAIAILKRNEENSINSDTMIEETDDYEIVDISIRSLVSGICRDHNCMGEFLKINDQFVCVINCENDKSVRDIKRITTDIVKKAKMFFDISLSYSLSSVSFGLSNLPKCYSEAEEAENYKRLFNRSDNICYQEYISGKSGELPLSDEFEKGFIKNIRSGNYENCIEQLNAIFEKLIYDGDLNYSAVTGIIDSLNSFFRSEVSQSTVIFEKDKPNLINAINSGQNIEEVYNVLTELLKKMCGYTRKNGKEDISDRIKKYIDENYSDGNLQVAAVAEKFNLNTSYIIKLFKDHTSMTLLEYISVCRVKKAAELIRETSYSFEEIAQMTGFNHIRTFNRTFKKLMGISPANYRETFN